MCLGAPLLLLAACVDERVRENAASACAGDHGDHRDQDYEDTKPHISRDTVDARERTNAGA